MHKFMGVVLPVVAGALIGVCSTHLCGCAELKTARTEARPAVLFVLKEAYACGGKEIVSNRIDQLVADGKVTPEQAANLPRLAQDVYDGVVERIEAKVIEDALAATNAVGAVEQ